MRTRRPLFAAPWGLSCATRIITALLALSHGLSENEKEILEMSLTGHVQCEGDQVSILFHSYFCLFEV